MQKKKVKVLEQAFDTQVGPGLITINDILAAPNVGTSFYQKMAEYLLGMVTSGKMTADQALLLYRRTFIYLTGVQIKGLILASENAHLLKNKEDIKRETLKHHSEHIERITAQAKRFLDGAEMLVVFGFPYAGCTMDYRKRITEDNDSPYQPIDSVAADAMGVKRQIVTRLVWDPQVPTQYPWADNAPLDYANYFPFLKERMAKLAAGKTFSLYLVRDGVHKKAVVENGTVHSMSWRIPGEKKMHAMVLRHTFIFDPRGSTSTRPWVLVVDSNAAKIFDLSEEEANRFPGTVGGKLLNSSESGDGKIGFSLETTNVRTASVSASFFAWLPDQFHAGKYSPLRNGYNYRIKSRYFNFLSTYERIVGRNDDVRTVPSFKVDWGHAAALKLTRHETSTSDPNIHYGDVVSLSLTTGGKTLHLIDRSYSWYMATNPGARELLVVEPLPFVTGTFMNPKKNPILVCEGLPFMLKLRSTGNFMQEIDGEEIQCFENKKINGVFWTFYGY